MDKITWDNYNTGLTYARACELEGHDYPRIACALFNFDKLTEQEKLAEISRQEDECQKALVDAKIAYKVGKANVSVNKRLGIKGMGGNFDKHKQALKYVKLLEAKIKGLCDRLAKSRLENYNNNVDKA